MKIDIAPYLSPEYTYTLLQSPDLVRTHEDAVNKGVNCYVLAHLALRDALNVELPSNLRCYEMFMDKEYFDDVHEGTPLIAGDLIWFGLKQPRVSPEDFVPEYDKAGFLTNWRIFPVKHVGIHTGFSEEDDPLILHASWYTGGNAIWPLSRFNEYDSYKKVYAVRRALMAH